MSSPTRTRKPRLLLLFLAVALGVATPAMCMADCQAQAPKRPQFDMLKLRAETEGKLELRPGPAIEAPKEAPLTPELERRIEELITQLAAQPDEEAALAYCYEADRWLWQSALDPPPAGELTEDIARQKYPWPKPFIELVKLGPKAMPALLRHLDDPTPTNILVLSPHPIYMSHEWVLDLNPVDPRETQYCKDFYPSWFPAGDNDPVDSYRVKVGDVCFVILGHIVGRSYFVLRRFPTAGANIASPVGNPALAKAVRTIWADPQPAKRLFESLVNSIRTHGAEPDKDGRARMFAEQYRLRAEKRLRYYFPDQAKALIPEKPPTATSARASRC